MEIDNFHNQKRHGVLKVFPAPSADPTPLAVTWQRKKITNKQIWVQHEIVRAPLFQLDMLIDVLNQRKIWMFICQANKHNLAINDFIKDSSSQQF